MSEIDQIKWIAPRGRPDFRWSQRSMQDRVVISIAGELDLATADELQHRLRRVVDSDGATTILLDLSEVRFLDCHTIGLMVRAWSAARIRGRTLQVDGLDGMPARVFAVLGLERLLAPPQCWQISEGQLL